MAHLTFDLTKPGGAISNIAKAVCIWDCRTFLNNGAFGSMADGAFKARCPFIEYAILMTFTGGAGRGEFYNEDENGHPVYNFAPALEVLRNVLRQGVKPIIVIGNVPYYMSQNQHSEYDSYEWGNRCAPDDWDVYHAYIVAFAQMIRDNFPAEEYRTWAFRVGTEPDNEHWWTPGEEAYIRLYDYTVDALQTVLGRENLTVFSGNLSRIELFDTLYQHCHSGVNLRTGKIGTQNDAMSISHYNDINPDSPCEYYDLRNCLYFVRGRMDKLAPGTVKSFNVGEGQFIMDGGKPAFRLAMAQDASSYSASWTAHMFDAMTEQGFEYFANWAWAADWFFTKEDFLPIPAWYSAKFMQEMAGGKRIGAEGFVLNKVGNTVGGFGSLHEDGTLRLMLYNHNIDRADSEEALTVTLKGLGGAYACEAEQIDATTCFFRDWEAKSAHIQRAARDVDIATVGSMYDSDIVSILKDEDKAFWRSMKAKYARQPQTMRYPLDVAGGNFTLTMPGHSVVMLTLTPDHLQEAAMNDNFRAKWNDPPREHRVNAIIHEWHENRQTQMDAIVDYGFGGVVTNPSHRGSYQDFLRAIPEFAKIVAELEQRGLGFWLYDEFGYPSGYAGGETLEGHPELEAKGFYMRRYVAYEPRTVRHHLDCESDKIIWAAKYPIDNPVMHESLVRYDEMMPVPFTDTCVEADLKAAEALFVFCVKSAYEGSQCTHNTCSYSRYINIMNPAAVDRFIELMFEPIEKAVPGVIARAKAIFTDEPSLMVGYSRDYEEWPYAIAPWVDGLFEKYEARWGESLLPRLPLLFEGAAKGGTTRSRFYQLVGEIIAESYSGRLQAWCKAHGGTFSGHYLGEESIYGHVMYYGAYMPVLQKTGYPGLDVLDCVPERYNYSTAKHTQMAARKMGAAGMMAEICPFGCIEEFRRAPYANMLGVMGLLYLSGVRVTNSYFTSNWEEFAPDKLRGANGYMSRAQAREFNGYISRMSTMLEGLQPQTDVFVYYGFEDASARFVPHHSAHFPADTEVDASCKRITDAIFEHGHDFLYADAEDFVAARETGCISGTKVRAVIVPAMDVIDADALDALLTLERRGVKLFFMERTPTRCIGSDAPVTAALTACSCDEVLQLLDRLETDFRAEGGSKLMKAKFQRDGHTVWMLHNGSREAASVRLTCPTCEKWDPLTGNIEPVAENGIICIPALQSVFVVL